MTSEARYCANCGAELTAGARYCTVCRALVAAANLASTFCIDCGAALQPGHVFCNSCRAPAGAQTVTWQAAGSPGVSQPFPWIIGVGVLAVVLASVFAFIRISGTGSNDSKQTLVSPSNAVGGPEAQASPTETKQSGPTPRPRVPAPLPAPVTVEVPVNMPDALLGDPNKQVATLFADELRAVGLDPESLRIVVFPVVSSSKHSLLVINVSQEMAQSQDKNALLMQAVTRSRALKDGNVSQVAANMKIAGTGGPTTLTMIASISVLERVLAGTLSTQEAAEQVVFQIKQGGQ